jgi:hypothetical protein
MTQAWRTRSAAFVISLISLGLGVASPVFAQSNYRLVELGSLKPVYDINNEGMAVGFYVFGDTNGNLGYKWTESTGDVPLVPNPADINKFPFFSAGALAVNRGGTVVGQGRESGAAPFTATVMSPAGVLTFLPPAPLEAPPAIARKVNSSGAVVGLGRLNDQAAFYWTAATGTELISPDPFSEFMARDALDINDAGIVAGWCTGSECPFGSGYLWARTGGHFVIPKVAGQSNVNHEAWAINNLNQVVGRYGNTGVFFWSAATGTIDLGAPAGSVTHLDINDRGHIVASITTPGVSTAYLYRNGTWTDLNTFRQPGETFSIEIARAINNDGWIVGTGNGALLAGFVLIPPTVDVTVNGSDGPLTIGPGTPVQMSLAFDPGNGASLNPGEVYAGIATPFGLYWKTPTGYTLTPTRLYAGPVPNFGPIALISVGAGLLPPGTYTWITIVDNDTNGVINAHYYDYVVTTVIP